MRRKSLYTFMFVIISCPVFAWGPITHYHLAKQAGGRSGFICSFCSHAMYPDSFITGDVARHWIDPAHAPNPAEKPFKSGTFPFANDPMLGFLMFHVSESNLDQQDVSLGWGCHISADWVAHHYFKIVDVETEEAKKYLIDKITGGQMTPEERADFLERLPKFLFHLIAETIGDLKALKDFGPFFPSSRFYPEMVQLQRT